MGVMIAAAAIGAAGAIAGGAISANGAKSAAAKAADANSKATSDTNALNLDMFNQSRGSTGHAILPTYFGNNETDAANQAYANFQRLNMGADEVGANLYNYQRSLDPSVHNSLAALQNRYNGVDLSQRLADSQPVWDARAAYAQTQGAGLREVAQAAQGGINIGLAQQLAAQNAQRTAQGYLGSSTFDRNRAVASTIMAQQAAAGQMANANATGNNLAAQVALQNAQERGNFQLSDLDFRSNPAALGSAMSNLAALQSTPWTTQANLYTAAQQPLNFFRIGTQAYNQPFSPQVSPGINNGQIIGGAVTELGKLGQAYFTSQTPQTPAVNNYAVNSPYSAGLMSGYQFNPNGGFAPQTYQNFNPNSFQNFNTGPTTPTFNSQMPPIDYSAYGGTASTFGGTCYIARRVYGSQNPKWKEFRTWLMTSAPVSLLVAYVNGADELAPLINPKNQSELRVAMDSVLRLSPV